ncbi:MAG: hypothetical protein H6625_03685 [Bdellovibrionaceae bacterium]|nr:hypothetical protein [Pseudobdellovibrionaceae bacterium]
MKSLSKSIYVIFAGLIVFIGTIFSNKNSIKQTRESKNTNNITATQNSEDKLMEELIEQADVDSFQNNYKQLVATSFMDN